MLTGFVFTGDYAESIIAVRAHTKMHKNYARCHYTTANDRLLYKTNACNSDYGCCDSFSHADSLQRSYLTMAKRCRTERSACESHKLLLMPALHYSKCLIDLASAVYTVFKTGKKLRPGCLRAEKNPAKTTAASKRTLLLWIQASKKTGHVRSTLCSSWNMDFIAYGIVPAIYYILNLLKTGHGCFSNFRSNVYS